MRLLHLTKPYRNRRMKQMARKLMHLYQIEFTLNIKFEYCEVFIISMDLDFWKYKEGAIHNNSKVYELGCCDGEIVEGLECLPIDEIFTTSQIVRFNCYSMSEVDMNSLMDILIDFGCPLYDPQIATRFDTWTDR